jgi:hypothetical protein
MTHLLLCCIQRSHNLWLQLGISRENLILVLIGKGIRLLDGLASVDSGTLHALHFAGDGDDA